MSIVNQAFCAHNCRTGQNPTGRTLSLERRREIYALCQKYDVIIIEDDPYWNLQYPSAYKTASKEPNVRCNYNAHGKSSGYDFLDSLVPSYLSVDVDGRVVRLDTFSKTVAPGCRLGWITAQPAIIERLARITETSTQQPSGFVQSMVAELILGQQDDSTGSGKDEQSWKMDGWVRWLAGLRAGYERRMQVMCNILDDGKHIIRDGSAGYETWEIVDKVQMYEFSWPTGGMFVWLKACLETHPLHSKYRPEKLSRALWAHLIRKPYLCLAAPGTMFASTPESVDDAVPYMRLCFAAIGESEVSDISQRLVDGFRSFWQRKSLDDEDALELVDVGRLPSGFGC